MSQPTRVAAIQLTSGEDPLQNLRSVEGLVEQAKAAGASLAVLPENFAFFGTEARRRQLAERLGDNDAPIQSTLRHLARTHSIALVAGGWPEQSSDPQRPYNTLTTYDPSGTLVGHYRKIHLFDVDLANGTAYRESESTMAGSEAAVAEVLGMTVGLSICYDLRFPELYRRLVDLGAQVIPPPCFVYQNADPQRVSLFNGAENITNRITDNLITSRIIDYSFFDRHYFTSYQTSMTRGASLYWNKVNILSNQVGSIFDTPPAMIIGNIKNVNRNSEEVLGYFQAIHESFDRFFVLPSDLPFPLLITDCQYDDRNFDRYPSRCLDCIKVRNSSYQRPDWF